MIISDKMKERINQLAKEYALELLLLYGSQARGDAHKESDIDTAYLSSRKLTFEEEMALDSHLTGVFQNDNVQLVNVRRASPLLLKLIVKDAVPLYERSRGILDDLYIYALRLYEEAKPLFELRSHYVNKKIKAYQHVG